MFLDPISSPSMHSSTGSPTQVSNQALDPILPINSNSAEPESVTSDSNHNHSAEHDSLSHDHIPIVVPPASIPSLRREGLITFGCPHVYDIVPFGRPDGTSPPGFVPPRCPYTLGRRPCSD
nr:hypothetical protein CFP56_57710 [Quercus suber]